jgi:hypothetical protein
LKRAASSLHLETASEELRGHLKRAASSSRLGTTWEEPRRAECLHYQLHWLFIPHYIRSGDNRLKWVLHMDFADSPRITNRNSHLNETIGTVSHYIILYYDCHYQQIC